MNETTIPSYVDTRKVFLQVGKLSGSIELNRMPRFKEALVDDDADIQVELEFSVNRSKQRLIVGKLWASVVVSCQRCLEPVRIDLEDAISLALVRNESEATKLEESLDPWILEDHKLDIAVLVEEQLLLCLPIVSTHDDENCLTALDYVKNQSEEIAEAAESDSSNPFAILKSLKE